MRITCPQFPGELIEACLEKRPPLIWPEEDRYLRLEVDPPVYLGPAEARGTVLVEVSDAERAALAEEGFQLGESPPFAARKVTREAVAAAVNCARCREIVERHADPTVSLRSRGRVDLADQAGYVISQDFQRAAGGAYFCPDCRRVVHVEEHRNMISTSFPLDRDV